MITATISRTTASGRVVRSCQVKRSTVQPAHTNRFCLRRSEPNRCASTCHAQPSTSTATRSAGKGEVQQVALGGVAESPPGNPGLAQQPNKQPLRSRGGPVRGSGEQRPHPPGASTAEAAAVRAVRGFEPHVALQGAVEERRAAIAERDRGLEHAQRNRGDR